MADIRVTVTYASGIVRSWQSRDGDTEPNLKRRMRDARRGFRHGPGWMERDYTEPQPHVERIEWVEAGGGSDG